jgi:hypothetical protein
MIAVRPWLVVMTHKTGIIYIILTLTRLILGAFQNCEERLLASSCLSVRPYVCVSVRPHGTTHLPLDGVSWNLIGEYLFKSIEKIEVWLKSDNNNGYFTWRSTYIYDISLNSSYNENFFRQNLYRKAKDILCWITFFPENHSVYEIMWKNIVEPNMPQMTRGIIRLMPFSCWITKARGTHS